MSVTGIHRTAPIARKEYNDDGWEFINEWIVGGCCVGTFKHPMKITFAEARLCVAFKNRPKPWRILKGDRYERQFNSYDGHTYVWRMNKKMYDLACKYDLFPEI